MYLAYRCFECVGLYFFEHDITRWYVTGWEHHSGGDCHADHLEVVVHHEVPAQNPLHRTRRSPRLYHGQYVCHRAISRSKYQYYSDYKNSLLLDQAKLLHPRVRSIVLHYSVSTLNNSSENLFKYNYDHKEAL